MSCIVMGVAGIRWPIQMASQVEQCHSRGMGILPMRATGMCGAKNLCIGVVDSAVDRELDRE